MKSSKLLFSSRTSALSQLNRILHTKAYANANYFILVDENTCNHCLSLLISKVEALQESEFLEIESGEINKSLEIASQLWQALLEMKSDRDSVIVNLGGGVISDLGGFVASGFKRGIRYINVPTSLVGMIDASIGGKTAINLGTVKNQVGFFHFPEICCIEPEFLNTLPKRELISGVFEALKTLLIGDAQQYIKFQEELNSEQSLSIQEVIKTCALIKESIVKKDPAEKGIRKMLNFGHTFGHAIESFSLRNDKNPLLHGEAVGIGMICEMYLSMKKLGFPEGDFMAYKKTVESLIHIPQYSLSDTEVMLSYMRHDKKNINHLIHCTLLRKIGEIMIDVPLDENEIREALLTIGR